MKIDIKQGIRMNNMHTPLLEAMDRLMTPATQPQIRERQERHLRETVVDRCAEAVRCLTYAIAYPGISRRDIEEARAKLDAALAAASILDPEDTPSLLEIQRDREERENVTHRIRGDE